MYFGPGIFTFFVLENVVKTIYMVYSCNFLFCNSFFTFKATIM